MHFLPLKFKYLSTVLQQPDRQQHKRTALCVKAQHHRLKDVDCVNDPAGIGSTNVAYIVTISVDNVCSLRGLIDLAFAANSLMAIRSRERLIAINLPSAREPAR